jgi:adenylyltransferase/sulfurtransferase
MQSITARELKNKIKNNDIFQLIDVREPYEHAEFNLGGLLIPLSNILQSEALINRDKPVIVYCHKGIRSQIAIQRLQQKFGFTNLINLIGGTAAWQNQIGI